MALKEQLMVKTVIGNEDLELKADPGEAFLIKDIGIYRPVAIPPSNEYATLKIEKTTVGFFRIAGILGSHLFQPVGRSYHSHDIWGEGDGSGTHTNTVIIKTPGGAASQAALLSSVAGAFWVPNALYPNDTPDSEKKTLLGLLFELGIFKGYPVAEGETFRIEGAKAADTVQVVKYEVYEPGDISPEQENGSKSKEYFFLNYGNCGGSIQTEIDNLYTTSRSPAEFPDFPFGKVVPAKHEIDLIGICASEFGPGENDGVDYSVTKFIKLVKDREVLFDEDRNGLLFYIPWTDSKGGLDHVGDGISLFGNYSSADYRKPLLFPTPLTMSPGDELGIYVTLDVGGTGQALTIEEHEIALIEKVRRVE